MDIQEMLERENKNYNKIYLFTGFIEPFSGFACPVWKELKNVLSATNCLGSAYV